MPRRTPTDAPSSTRTAAALAALGLACAAASPLAAQAPAPSPAQAPAQSSAPRPAPSIDPDGSAVVAELEIVGRPAGPALWRVRKGGSEVVILGAVSPLPHALDWNDLRLKRALEGAHVLLLPPVARAGVFDLPALAMDMFRAKTRATLAAQVPPALYARTLVAARVAQLDPRKLDGWKPAAAGFILVGAFDKAAGLSRSKPSSTVSRLGREAHVPVRNMVSVKAMPIADALVRQDAAGQVACLEAAVEQVEQDAAHAQPASRAWAEGRLAALRAEHPSSPIRRCFEMLPSGRAALTRGITEAQSATEAALREPGRSVAVVEMQFLLARDGLLDRLRAGGAEVTVPP